MPYSKGLVLLHRQMLYAPDGKVYIGDARWTESPAWTQGAYLAGVARTAAGLAALVRRDGLVAVDILDGYPAWIDDPDIVSNSLGKHLITDSLHFDSGLITVCTPDAKEPATALVPPRKGPFEVKAFSYPIVNATRVTLIFENYNDKDVPTDPWMLS